MSIVFDIIVSVGFSYGAARLIRGAKVAVAL